VEEAAAAAASPRAAGGKRNRKPPEPSPLQRRAAANGAAAAAKEEARDARRQAVELRGHDVDLCGERATLSGPTRLVCHRPRLNKGAPLTGQTTKEHHGLLAERYTRTFIRRLVASRLRDAE